MPAMVAARLLSIVIAVASVFPVAASAGPRRFARDLARAEHAVQSLYGRALSPGSVKLRMASRLLEPERLARRYRQYGDDEVARFVTEMQTAVLAQVGSKLGDGQKLTADELFKFRDWAASLHAAVLVAERMPGMEQYMHFRPEAKLGAWIEIQHATALAEPGSRDYNLLLQYQNAGAFRTVYIFTNQPTRFQRDLAKARVRLYEGYLSRTEPEGRKRSFHHSANHLAPWALQLVLEPSRRESRLHQYGQDEVRAALSQVARALVWPLLLASGQR
jgi:hypothetical protein